MQSRTQSSQVFQRKQTLIGCNSKEAAGMQEMSIYVNESAADGRYAREGGQQDKTENSTSGMAYRPETNQQTGGAGQNDWDECQY